MPPLQMLMCVLPPASAHCLPREAQKLMTEPHSPLAKYYPLDFPLDPNGKPAGLRWLWVALLPPCDVDVVARTFSKLVFPSLTPDEKCETCASFYPKRGTAQMAWHHRANRPAHSLQ